MALKGLLHTPYVVSFRGKDVHGGKSRNFGGITGILKTVSVPPEPSEAATACTSGRSRRISGPGRLLVSPGIRPVVKLVEEIVLFRITGLNDVAAVLVSLDGEITYHGEFLPRNT